MGEELSKFRVPVGSLIVDASLVIALIWWGATMNSQVQGMAKRLEVVEMQKIQPEADRRLAVLEAVQTENARRLVSIEHKLDLVLENKLR